MPEEASLLSEEMERIQTKYKQMRKNVTYDHHISHIMFTDVLCLLVRFAFLN